MNNFLSDLRKGKNRKGYKMVLNKRIKRDFRENLIRNSAMTLIIAMAMSLVVAMCSNTDSITAAIKNGWRRCNVEDGSFETYTPLSTRNFNELSELDCYIEKMFYTDIDTSGGGVLRFFAEREKINLAYVESGKTPEKDNEMFLEKLYAKNHSLKVGDSVTAGGKTFYICGIGCLPDYAYVKRNTSDVSSSTDFGFALVTKNAFQKISSGSKIIYSYSFKLGKNCTLKDLKDKLLKLKFDKTSVKDTHIKDQVQKADNLRDEFISATDALMAGSLTLSEGIKNFGKTVDPSGTNESINGLKDGALGLYSGMFLLQSEFGKYIDESTYFEIINLSSFMEAKYNIRINDPLNDSKISKQSALVAGVILLILLVYMLSVFASGAIEKERSVIGTLYALGYRKDELLSHFMAIPMIVAVLGAVLGTIGGFMLMGMLTSTYESMYSFPETVRVYPAYLFAYSLGMPIVFSYFVNRYVLSKKLNASPLAMIRGEHKSKGGININPAKFSFCTKYKIRQFLREIKGNVTLFFGIFVSILLITFSVACYSSVKNYIDNVGNDVKYEYMYILRNPVSDLPKNSVLGYTRGFFTDYSLTGGEMEVTLLGVDKDNPYFPYAADFKDASDEIYMSSSARIKFGLKKGDKIILRENAEDKLYAFTIADEVQYGSGLYFFMDINAMRKAFSLTYFDEDDLKLGERPKKSEYYYYNTVFSDKRLTFKHNMTLSEVSKADTKKSADKFMTLMWGMILMLIGVSVIIFIAVMYLLMKLEIDRSAFSVSLLKALGYDEKTVNSFYLGSSFYVTAFALVFGLPVSKLIVNALYPYCVSNTNGGFEAVVTPLQYVLISAIVICSYLLTRLILTKYLKKIKLTEILKNRE